MNAQDLIHRFEAVWGARKEMESTWNEIERLVSPIRSGDFYDDDISEYQVEWDRKDIFDTTGMEGANRLAKAMAGYLTAGKFFELNYRNTDLNTNKEASVWLEDVGSRIYEALQDSNFDGEMASAYLDLVSFGNAFIMEEVENELQYDGISFNAIPLKEAFFEPDYEGKVEYFYRKLNWSYVQIVSKFGEDNCPDDIVKMANEGMSPDAKEAVIFCIFRRKEFKKVSPDRPVVAPEDREWGWKYILRKGHHVFSEGGYYEQPAYVSIWEKTSGSYWGFGPSHLAIATINGVNEERKLMKVAATKNIDPPFITEQRNIVGDVDLDPGGETVVKDINGIRTWETGGNYMMVKDDLGMDQQAIRNIYYYDDLNLKDSPAMTATEVMERTERLIKLLGGVFGRMQKTLLNPVVERTFNILLRAGELPEVPQSVIEANQDQRDMLDINYTGALARAMASEDVIAAGRWAGGIIEQAMAIQDMSMLDVIDFDEMNRGTHELLGISAKFVKSAEQVDEIRETRAQQQQAAQQAEQLKAEGEAMQAQGDGRAAMEGAPVQ